MDTGRYSIIFSSLTGNTKKLADTIRAVLPSEDCDYYGVPVVGVSNVGPVTGGAWAGWKCIGNSIALFGDGESGVTLPYGEDAVCLRIIDVPLRKDSRYGTALATEVEAAH